MKSARFSMDLLEKVPTLSIDPVSQKIVSARGSVKILIDGMSAEEIDLKSIPPDKVDRIDFYDIPPARYIGYSTVVNIITKHLEDGFAAGVTLQHAFTTGFANDDAFIKYIHKRSQFTANYRVNYRDYSDVNTEVKYSYLMNDKLETRNEYINNPFGYTDHFINLSYINQLQNNYVFQIKFSPNMNFNHSKEMSEVDFLINETGTYRTGNKTNKSKTFNPWLNLYLWKQLNKGQSVTIDVFGNMFDANQTAINQEYNKNDNQLELNDRMGLNNIKHTIIGEAIYERTLNFSKFSFGNKVETYKMNSKVENSFDNKDYASSYFSDYFYGNYTVGRGSLMFYATLGVTYRQSDNSINHYNAWLFSPYLLLGYAINEKNMLRIIYWQTPKEAGISQQSDNVIFVTDNILRKGNPYLKNSNEKVISLTYGFVDKRFELDLYLAGGTDKKDINSYYIKSDDYYVLTSLNSENTMYGLAYMGAIKPFENNLLTVKFSGEVSKSYLKNEVIGSYSYWYAPFTYEVSMKIKNFTASYQGKIVAKELSGTYLKQDENASHLMLRYTHKNFSVWGSWLYIFIPSHYVTETIPLSVVIYSSDRKIYDNKNMFTLGLSWTFNKGKKYQEQEKLINNRDTDAGLF
jgi:hypothetical protein